MRFFNKLTDFDFTGRRQLAFMLSGALIVVSLLSLVTQGLNFGIDFTGGTLVQVRFEQNAPIVQMRQELDKLDLGDMAIQEFGDPREALIRFEKQGKDNKEQQELLGGVMGALEGIVGKGKVEQRRVEFVGPQVGDELAEQGLLAMLLSLGAILIYVAFRFEARFAVGAVAALIHDVFLTMGFFSLIHHEFTLVVVAALLTVVGYSLNDTIVVYDRIREEMKRLKKQPLGTVINEAVNRTLSRTLVTSLTTILVLLALLVLGGAVIHDFALTLFFGVVVGTYSSIFVASPVIMFMDKGKPSPLQGGKPTVESA
ncbi:protein translocase subunit SecF [Magnetofaba australis]|uniref:Protein-export membrane protein SecF n=1 Tax=Magnetofaba australis IT-1 TaxID=1434232 RepID=A0A1Y2K270_9PROT|nr:protein translocase subunit SecF [Magnetofaba australis]OSM02049.1 putative protein translocase subunit secF [Magnetofaba australis IT-1]